MRGKVQTQDADSRCANHTGYTSAERVNEWQRAISIFFFGGGKDCTYCGRKFDGYTLTKAVKTIF